MDVEKENKIPILEQSFFLIKNLNLSPWITSPCLAVTIKSLNSSTLQPSSSAWAWYANTRKKRDRCNKIISKTLFMI